MTTALILAGRRDGTTDPLAAAAGVSHKCIAPVAGRPMIVHVLETLTASLDIGTILISIDDVTALDGIPEVRDGVERGVVRIVQAEHNLVDSVFAALADAAWPVLITTADNVLLDAGSVAAIGRRAQAGRADVAVAFARRAAVLAAHPDGQRRFYRFSDDSYSNCNSYWLGSARALAAAEVFRRGGQFAKHPMRIVRAFGLINLIRFRYGIGSLDDAFRRFSRRFRLSIQPAVLANGAVAIDVDNARTLGVVEELLRAELVAAAE